MTALCIEALVAIAQSLSALMAGAWKVRPGSHIAVRTAGITDDRYRDYQSRTSMFFPLPPQKGVVT
jgi:steroid 5-alpha reductase family enzyme